MIEVKKYKLKKLIEAVQLTEHNLIEVENWSGGCIKGTALPAVERVIDIQVYSGEIRAEIGDFIIKDESSRNKFKILKEFDFNQMFEEDKNDREN